MDYRVLLQEENEAVGERISLSMERICAMEGEEMREPYGFYFKRTASFIRMMGELLGRRRESADFLGGRSIEELKEENRRLYGDILPEAYGESFANPDYAAEMLGEELGPLLAFLYTELRAQIVYVFEMRLELFAALNEVFLEVYSLFSQAWEEGREAPAAQEVKDVLYWFVSDYADVAIPWRVREGLDPALSFAVDIVMNSDLEDPRYLFQYGEFVSDSDLELAAFMGRLPQEEVDRMADTYTEGFRRGFEVMGRDLGKKRTVVLEYPLGLERMMRRAVKNFRDMGLSPIIYRAAVESVNRRVSGKRGYFGSSPNRQYEYDHRYDSAVYMGNGFRERKLSVTRTAYEAFKEQASWCAGPAVAESFGEAGFEPVNKKTALALTAHQQQAELSCSGEIRRIVNQYMPGDETSFTIIAFPRPEIGPDFEEIFRETIKINTLDYEKYQKIQQRIIDALDAASYVSITGREGNETALRVALHPLTDRERETNFENCVADVNIPLGEVFTSPVLAGTEGLLHVKEVYIGEYLFKDLRIAFREGRTAEYSCGNFQENENAPGVSSVNADGASGRPGTSADAEAQGRELVKQVIFRGHGTLPLGEFAIGTNTAAYAMARRFGISGRLPILIAEKTGPHFAVGDTCYSFAEDSPMYNPDGKEVIARDNEISILRKEDPAKAYFNCHTDITIPYSELGDIRAVGPDGRETEIIRQGRFVLAGTEALNEALDKDFG